MKNVEKVQPFHIDIIKNGFGTITKMAAEFGVSEHGSISYKGQALLANYVYRKEGTYKLVYTILDAEGSTESFEEDDGILPTLFLSPDQENYVSVQTYDPDKDLEISIPVFNRDNTPLPKGGRPFAGYFTGTCNQFSIFYNVDQWGGKKPDKLLAIEFKNGVVFKKHNAKIELPLKNNIFIDNNEIHLLAKEGAGWLHRQTDEKGKEIRRRQINSDRIFFREVIKLSFEQDSYALAQDKSMIVLEKFDAQGNVTLIPLFDLGDPFYNTWRPVKIAEDTYVTYFNGEFGNGWFTIHNEKLLEIFYSKGVSGYKNLLTGEIFPMEFGNMIIGSICKTTSNHYAVVFYSMPGKDAFKGLFVLQRSVSAQ